MSDFQEDLVPSYVVASTTLNSASALICIAALFCAFLFGLVYANKHSILTALDAYMHAKYPTISLLISNDLHWRSSKMTEIPKPATSLDTKSRPPTESDITPKLDEESNGPFTSQPSDSRDRDKSNIDTDVDDKSSNFVHPTAKDLETMEQDALSKNQVHVDSASSENDYIAVEQPVAVEQRMTGATRSGVEVETPMSPNSPLTGLSQVRASAAVPANSAKEQAQLVDTRVQSATRSVIILDCDNDTVTSEDAHPSPPDSPIKDYKTRSAFGVECTAHVATLTTKRRRRRPQNKRTAQSVSSIIPLPGDGIHLQQPSPRPSPKANVNLYRPTESHVNPPPGYAQHQFHPQVDYRLTPRQSPNSGTFRTYTTSGKSAAARMNTHTGHSVPLLPHVPSTIPPFSDNHYPTMAPKTTAFQPMLDIAPKNVPRKIPNSPWSPFASGLNIDLGPQIRTVNDKHPSHCHQRSSSTGSFFQNNQGRHNLNGSFVSPLSINEDEIDRRYGQGNLSSLFSNPNPLSRPTPTSSFFDSQPVVALSWMPTDQVPEDSRQKTNRGEPYSTRQFSLFDKRLAFSSAEKR